MLLFSSSSEIAARLIVVAVRDRNLNNYLSNTPITGFGSGIARLRLFSGISSCCTGRPCSLLSYLVSASTYYALGYLLR